MDEINEIDEMNEIDPFPLDLKLAAVIEGPSWE